MDTELPVRYEQAKKALAECEQIDECKSWADKAAALMSYAKQAEDDTLMNHARRIQVRAIRRMGELIEEVEPGTGKNNQYVKAAGGHSLQSRRQVAQEAGLSEHRQVQAVRMARIPENEFESAVGQASVPTVTELTENRRVRDATTVLGNLKRFHESCLQNEPEEVARGLFEHEELTTLDRCDNVIAWLHKFKEILCTAQKNTSKKSTKQSTEKLSVMK